MLYCLIMTEARFYFPTTERSAVTYIGEETDQGEVKTAIALTMIDTGNIMKNCASTACRATLFGQQIGDGVNIARADVFYSGCDRVKCPYIPAEPSDVEK
jgi:hypothetical protein